VFRGYWERLTSSSASVQWFWIIAAFIFLGIVAAALQAGPNDTEAESPKKDAQAKKPSEKDAVEQIKEPIAKATPKAPSIPSKPEPLPPPHDPRERILYYLKKRHFDLHGTQVVVRSMPGGCKSAAVTYETPFVGSSLPYEADYYRVIYGDVELRHELCFVRTNAYRSTHDKYGNERRVRMLTTSMGRQTVEKINWEHKGAVNFRGLYNLEYMAPSARADIARENARHARRRLCSRLRDVRLRLLLLGNTARVLRLCTENAEP